MKAELIWNWECIRDFCGGFYNHLNSSERNKGLLYVLPEAVNAFAKESEDSDTVKAELIETILYIPDDYRTGINCKEVIIQTLIGNHEITDEEIVAILDVIYIDLLPTRVEVIADSLRKDCIKKRVLQNLK